MKKSAAFYFTTLLGTLLFISGLVLARTISDPKGIMQPLPFVLIGIGCGLLGHGMGEMLAQKTRSKNPQLAKQIEIEQNDERNVAIGNRAKAKAYDMMGFVYGVLMLVLTLMRTNLIVILLLVFCYLFVIGYGIYYRIRLDKEM